MKGVCQGCGIIQEIRFKKNSDDYIEWKYWKCKHCKTHHRMDINEIRVAIPN